MFDRPGKHTSILKKTKFESVKMFKGLEEDEIPEAVDEDSEEGSHSLGSTTDEESEEEECEFKVLKVEEGEELAPPLVPVCKESGGECGERGAVNSGGKEGREVGR